MNTTNRVQLTGNLGSKPEIKTFESGSKLATFSLATNEEITTKKGDTKTDTQWHLIAAWGKLADLIEAELNKGSHVSIDGRLTTRNYVDKAGQKRYVTEVVATDVLVKSKND